jgi:hypothetical protein
MMEAVRVDRIADLSDAERAAVRSLAEAVYPPAAGTIDLCVPPW